jgi:hypothetical protein
VKYNIPFPILLKIERFSLDVVEKQFKILAVSRGLAFWQFSKLALPRPTEER